MSNAKWKIPAPPAEQAELFVNPDPPLPLPLPPLPLPAVPKTESDRLTCWGEATESDMLRLMLRLGWGGSGDEAPGGPGPGEGVEDELNGLLQEEE